MSPENLKNEDALNKLRELVDKIDVAMLCTYPNKQSNVHAVPMSRQEIDSEANIWYLFSSESETFKNLQVNSNVSLLFSNPKDYLFLTLHGTATISRDQERIDKYWNPFVEAWFEKGKEDPRIRVLKVKIDDANYWDTKSNKIFTLFKIVSNTITGSKMDLGREGSLEL